MTKYQYAGLIMLACWVALTFSLILQVLEEVGMKGTRYSHSECHPESPTWAKVTEDTVIIECAECKKPIVKIHINREPVDALEEGK